MMAVGGDDRIRPLRSSAIHTAGLRRPVASREATTASPTWK